MKKKAALPQKTAVGKAGTPIDSIQPHDRNPRTISKDAFAKLCASIQRDPEFMVLRPIVTDNKGVIIGGNMRWRACKHMGMTELPDNWVIKASKLTTEQRKRFILVDNAPQGIAGEWDFDSLAADYNVAELLDIGFRPFELGLGDGENDPADVNQGMPEFNQDTLVHSSLLVHFRNANDRNEFAKIIQQAITAKTKSVWHPAEKRINGKEYTT